MPSLPFLSVWVSNVRYVHIVIQQISRIFHLTKLKLYSPLSWRRQWHPTPVLLPGKSHGWRSLIGCSPWGRYELDTTERLHFHALEKEMATHSSILACRIPGMEEPGGLPSMGSQSRTRLKQLSSSSSILNYKI